MSLRDATLQDDPFRIQNGRVVDGIMGLHVDDLIGGGEGVNTKQDVEEDAPNEISCFKHRAKRMLHRFRFGNIDFGYEQVFCGLQVEQSLSHEVVTLSLKRYVHNIKPVSLAKSRRQQPTEQLEAKEVNLFRSTLGALAWPANQCLPMLAASISLHRAAMSDPKVSDILDSNKTLRFAKEAVEIYAMKFQRYGRLDEIAFGVYSDAAWAVRPDGSSQGGMIVFIATESEMESEEPFPLTVVNWASKKLPRMCRSSLSAETQAAANAVDELGWTKVMWYLMLWPSTKPTSEDLLAASKSVAITDARSLYDAARSMSAGLKLAERRSAIELTMADEHLRQMRGEWKWCNSAQQMADGLTKSAARDNCLTRFSRGVISLKFDKKMVAAKKDRVVP